VIVGTMGWELARRGDESGDRTDRLMAVLPLEADPDAYDWRDFAGRDVLVSLYADADPAQVHRAVVAMIRAGARMALVVDHRGERPMDLYRPRNARK
jgi:hypothetical protein